jgi:hypothetical protein
MSTVTPQRMTPSEALVKTLAANGVTEVFGIMGSAYMEPPSPIVAGNLPFVGAPWQEFRVRREGRLVAGCRRSPTAPSWKRITRSQR